MCIRDSQLSLRSPLFNRLRPPADVADDTQQARPIPIDAARGVKLDGERRAVLAHVNDGCLDGVAGLDRPDPLAETGITVGRQEGARRQADERFRGIAVEGAGRRIGLDHKAGCQILDDQPISNGLKKATIGLLDVITWQGALLFAGSHDWANRPAKSLAFMTHDENCTSPEASPEDDLLVRGRVGRRWTVALTLASVAGLVSQPDGQGRSAPRVMGAPSGTQIQKPGLP